MRSRHFHLLLVLFVAFRSWEAYAKIILATNDSSPIPGTAVVADDLPKVIAYYLGYSNYRKDAPFTARQIDGSKLTHLIYGFVDINMTLPGQVELASGDPWADLNRPFGYLNPWNCPCCIHGNFEQLTLLKRQYPHLQTLLSIGGWEYSGLISDAVFTAENRRKLAESSVRWCLNYGFDGIDLDWEFPVHGGKEGNRHHPSDCENQMEFLLELRRQFDALGYNKRFLITLTVFWWTENNFECVDFFKIKGAVDWVNIITYEMMWSANFTRHHAQLFPGPLGLNPSVAGVMKGHTVMGVPASFFTMGVSVYGRSFRAVMPLNPLTSDGYNEPYTDTEFPVLSYDSIVDIKTNAKPDFKSYWDDQCKAPYSYDSINRVLVSYDDPRSIAAKAEWSNQNGFAGIFLFDIGYDKKTSDPNSILAATFKGISANPKFRKDYDVMCVKSPRHCNIDCDPDPPPDYDPDAILQPIIQNCSRPGDVALVFTGGPSARTLTILQELAALNVEATFLVSGNQIVEADPRNAGIILQARRLGHQIGQIGFSFRPYDLLKDAELQKEALRTDNSLSYILGQRPLFTGLPQRQYNARVHYALDKLGLRIIFPTLDQQALLAQENLTVLNAVSRKGSPTRNSWIISLSDFVDQTPGAVTDLVQGLQKQNYRIVSMATCHGNSSYLQYSQPLPPTYHEDVSLFQNPYYEACGSDSTQAGKVVFAFHGGPTTIMPRLLNYCLKRNIRTIIGVAGSMMRENAYYASHILRAYTEGHIIAHHGFNYVDFRTLTAEQILINMRKNDEVLSNLLGVMPKYLLAPFGRLDRRVISVIQNAGYLPLVASVDTFDAVTLSNSSLSTANSTDLLLDRLNGLLVNSFDRPQRSSFLITQQITYFDEKLQDAIILQVNFNGYNLSMARDCLRQTAPYQSVKTAVCGDLICFRALESCESCPQDCGECTDEYYKSKSIDNGPLGFITFANSLMDRIWILVAVGLSTLIMLVVCSYRFFLWRIRSLLRQQMKEKMDARLATVGQSSATGLKPNGTYPHLEDDSELRRRRI